MSTRGIVVLFSTINLMTATTLCFAGFQGFKQLISYGDCREVCAYSRIGFGANGLSDELLLVILLALSVVHLIGGLSALNMSDAGLMVFMSAYVLRFLILAIDCVVKGVIGQQVWWELLLLKDSRQSKISNDFRLCVTGIQFCFLLWSIVLMGRFRENTRHQIQRKSLHMILESWFLEKSQKTYN